MQNSIWLCIPIQNNTQSRRKVWKYGPLVGIGLTDLPKSGGEMPPWPQGCASPECTAPLFSVKSLFIRTTGDSANLATLLPTPFQFVQCVALVWPLSGAAWPFDFQVHSKVVVLHKWLRYFFWGFDTTSTCQKFFTPFHQ